MWYISNMIKLTIQSQIQKGIRKQGQELEEKDIGTYFGWFSNFGKVLPIDVGKKVWIKNFGLVMENNQQRDSRKFSCCC